MKILLGLVFGLLSAVLIFNNCGGGFEVKTLRSTETGFNDPTQRPPRFEPNRDSDEETPTADVCETALFCDDFESQTMGESPSSPWSVDSNQPDVVVDDSRAYSGQKSIRITTDQGARQRSGFIALEGNPVFPVSGNKFYSRAMIYLQSAPEEQLHWDIVIASGDVPGQPFGATLAFGGQYNKRYLGVYNTTPYNEFLSDCYQHSADEQSPQHRMVDGEWACFEWEFDGPNNRARMWVNGGPADNMDIQERSEGCIGDASDGRWLAPTYNKLQLGWAHYQTYNSPQEMWIDDVVVSENPIGCPE